MVGCTGPAPLAIYLNTCVSDFVFADEFEVVP